MSEADPRGAPLHLMEWIEMKNWIGKIGKAVWCHRAAYAGLTLAYGAKCAGFIDAEILAQIVTVLYCAMFSQRH